jgi:hypothetical protein
MRRCSAERERRASREFETCTFRPALNTTADSAQRFKSPPTYTS